MKKIPINSWDLGIGLLAFVCVALAAYTFWTLTLAPPPSISLDAPAPALQYYPPNN